ncbi:hypothetical protein ACIBG7_18535 [Nonomuraea sp. NPDC050328]|uniref:hypothetical protein n=1 Tax=Nonomuraea sp. NPDC050328 TaxID=3364361 RepID=UPI0037AEDA70
MKKTSIAALAGAAVLVLGAGSADAAWKEPAASYGGCFPKNTGYLRILQRDNLDKSVHGKCNSREGEKITWYSRSGVDKLVKPLTAGFEISLGGQVATCKPGKPGASKLPRFDCVTPSPSPSATPAS